MIRDIHDRVGRELTIRHDELVVDVEIAERRRAQTEFEHRGPFVFVQNLVANGKRSIDQNVQTAEQIREEIFRGHRERQTADTKSRQDRSNVVTAVVQTSEQYRAER